MNNIKIALDKNIVLIAFIVFSFFIQFSNLPAYDDDIGRFAHGYIALAQQGRFITEWWYGLFTLFNKPSPVNTYSANIFIFMLIVFSSVWMILKKTKKDSILTSLAVISIFIHPFIIENVSYHIDSIGMIFSLAIAIVFAGTSFNNKILTIPLCLVSIIIASSMYQIALTVFCVSVVFFTSLKCVDDTYSNKEIISDIAIKVACFVASTMIIVLISNLTIKSGYSKIVSEPIPINYEGAKIVVQNLSKAWTLIYTSFNEVQRCILTFLLLSYYTALIAKAVIKDRRVSFRFIFMLLSPIIAYFLILMPTVLFKSPVLMPRVLMAFGALVGILSIPTGMRILDSIRCLFALAFIVLTILTASAHVNTQKYLNDYTDDILRTVTAGAIADKNNASKINLMYVLPQNIPGEVQRNREAFPLVGRIMKLHFGNKWLMQNYIAYKRYNINLIGETKDLSGKIIVTNLDYDLLRRDDGSYLLHFK